MRYLLVISLIAAVMTVCTGCVSVQLNNTGNSIKGEGPLVPREYNDLQFDSVEIQENMELIYRKGDSDQVTVEIQENLAQYLDVSVTDNRLIIKARKNVWFDYDEAAEQPKVYITKPELKKLYCSGIVTIKDADPIETDQLDLRLSGMCNINLEVHAKKVSTSISGTGDILLYGTADQIDFNISGMGTINASELAAATGRINIDGSGNINVNCSEKLDLDVNGMGNITYKGNPEITKQNEYDTVNILQVD